MTDINIADIDDFILGLRYPKFAAYVVNNLAKHFEVSREDATTMWEDYRKRNG